MPIPQLPEALAQKVLDGCVMPWEVVPAVKVHELVKFHTEIPGSPTLYTATFILAMNKPKYESLPADLKKVIDDNSGQFAANTGRQDVGRSGRRGRGHGQEARQHHHACSTPSRSGALAQGDRAGDRSLDQAGRRRRGSTASKLLATRTRAARQVRERLSGCR